MGLLQIAPAEAPDAKVRMVIITGPPEAQFKVCAVEGTGNQREQDGCCFSGNSKDQSGAMPELVISISQEPLVLCGVGFLSPLT